MASPPPAGEEPQAELPASSPILALSGLLPPESPEARHPATPSSFALPIPEAGISISGLCAPEPRADSAFQGAVTLPLESMRALQLSVPSSSSYGDPPTLPDTLEGLQSRAIGARDSHEGMASLHRAMEGLLSHTRQGPASDAECALMPAFSALLPPHGLPTGIPGLPLRLPWPPAGSSSPELDAAPELHPKGLRASRDLKQLFRISATSSEASEPLITSAPDTNPTVVRQIQEASSAPVPSTHSLNPVVPQAGRAVSAPDMSPLQSSLSGAVQSVTASLGISAKMSGAESLSTAPSSQSGSRPKGRRQQSRTLSQQLVDGVIAEEGLQNEEGSAPQSTGSTMLDLKMLARRNCPSLHHGDPPATVAAALRGLVHVKLDNERLASLANGLLERLVNTATLCLANNRLAGVEDLGVLPQLRLLDLSHNALSTTPDLRGLTCLAALDLSHNSLPSLSTARLPHSLRFLQVSDNPVCTTAQGLASVEARLRSELPLFCWLNGACVPVLVPEPAQASAEAPQSGSPFAAGPPSLTALPGGPPQEASPGTSPFATAAATLSSSFSGALSQQSFSSRRAIGQTSGPAGARRSVDQLPGLPPKPGSYRRRTHGDLVPALSSTSDPSSAFSSGMLSPGMLPPGPSTSGALSSGALSSGALPSGSLGSIMSPAGLSRATDSGATPGSPPRPPRAPRGIPQTPISTPTLQPIPGQAPWPSATSLQRELAHHMQTMRAMPIGGDTTVQLLLSLLSRPSPAEQQRQMEGEEGAAPAPLLDHNLVAAITRARIALASCVSKALACTTEQAGSPAAAQTAALCQAVRACPSAKMLLSATPRLAATADRASLPSRASLQRAVEKVAQAALNNFQPD